MILEDTLLFYQKQIDHLVKLVYLLNLKLIQALWKQLHVDPETEKKIKKNQFQWKMAEPNYTALSWKDTKIVNYFTNYHSSLDLSIQ